VAPGQADDVLGEVARRLGATAALPRAARARRALSAALGTVVREPDPAQPAEERLRTASSDAPGTLSWAYRISVNPAAPPTRTAALLRRVDRAAGLGLRWSLYADLAQGLLTAGGPTSITVVMRPADAVVRVDVRRPDRPAADGPNDGWPADDLLAALAPLADLGAIRVELERRPGCRLSRVSVLLRRGRPASITLWSTSAPDDAAGLLPGLLEAAGASGGGDLLPLIADCARALGPETPVSWAETPPGTLRLEVGSPETTDPAMTGHDPSRSLPLERLLHTARAHLVGHRLCADLLHGPLTIGVGLGGPSPVVDLDARLAPATRPRRGGAAPRSRTPVDAAESATAAVDHLVATQSAGGGWWDLAVSAGASGNWLTAVTGLALLEARDVGLGRAHEVRRGLSAAVGQLHLAQLPGGGWGWNEALDADCDSTAHAVLLLHRCGGVERRSVETLRNFQAPTGAFLTYRDAPAGHSWGQVHQDVHPAAVRALAQVDGVDDPAVTAGLAVVGTGSALQPPWPAFWWRVTSYGAHVALRCLEDVGRLDLLDGGGRRSLLEIVGRSTPDPLETALACSIALALGHPVADRLLARLVAGQQPDGSWAARPALRVVAPDVHRPWEPGSMATAGPLHPEVRRVFTTAVALDALARAQRRARRT
jgi:hypothetical protein